MSAIKGIVLGAAIGLASGVGGYTFFYAKGASYLRDDPAACANCHIMHEQYDAWMKSSHRQVATCNDCHTPAGFVPKYLTKAANGFWHSFAFTSGRFHEPIQITPRNHEITESACRKCHEGIVQAIDHGATAPLGAASGASVSSPLSCVRCHRAVGHALR